MKLTPEGWRVGVHRRVTTSGNTYSEGRRETGEGGKTSLED